MKPLIDEEKLDAAESYHSRLGKPVGIRRGSTIERRLRCKVSVQVKQDDHADGREAQAVHLRDKPARTSFSGNMSQESAGNRIASGNTRVVGQNVGWGEARTDPKRDSFTMGGRLSRSVRCRSYARLRALWYQRAGHDDMGFHRSAGPRHRPPSPLARGAARGSPTLVYRNERPPLDSMDSDGGAGGGLGQSLVSMDRRRVSLRLHRL